jgi:hypothetical protein
MGYELNFTMQERSMGVHLVFGYGKKIGPIYKGSKFGVEMRVWW